jgi:hypothetical protein
MENSSVVERHTWLKGWMNVEYIEGSGRKKTRRQCDKNGEQVSNPLCSRKAKFSTRLSMCTYWRAYVQLCAEDFLNFGLKLTTYHDKSLASRELSVMQFVAVRLLVGRNILSLRIINQIWHPNP